MPEIGVLELKIEDSSNKAAGGLKELATALTTIRDSLRGGLNLPTQAIKNFAAAISSNSKALANTGTFLNAVKEYQKVFKDAEKVKFDASPITEIQNALTGGIKIGQAGTQLSKLRDAMTKDWGQVADNGEEIHSAVSGMKAIKDMAEEFATANVAKNIRDVAESLTELTKAQNDMPSGGAHDLYGMQALTQSNIGIGNNFGEGIKLGLESTKAAVAEAAAEIADVLVKAIKERLDIHSPSGVGEDIGENVGKGIVIGLTETKSTLEAVSGEVADVLKQALYANMSQKEDRKSVV